MEEKSYKQKQSRVEFNYSGVSVTTRAIPDVGRDFKDNRTQVFSLGEVTAPVFPALELLAPTSLSNDVERPSAEELLFREEEESTLPLRKNALEKSKWDTWLQENWEDCTNLNISFQDLGDPYQMENLKRILRRLIRVETLWLVDNSLQDLSAIRLPRCRVLNMNRNHFTSFKQLPSLPQIEHLSLAENHIERLTGLSSLQHTPLESLILRRNPCEFHQNYRKCVFSCLPNLRMLDGIMKLPDDSSPPETSTFSKICTVS